MALNCLLLACCISSSLIILLSNSSEMDFCFSIVFGIGIFTFFRLLWLIFVIPAPRGRVLIY